MNDILFRKRSMTYFPIKNSCKKPRGIFPCEWKLCWWNPIDENIFFLACIKDDFNELVPSQREKIKVGLQTLARSKWYECKHFATMRFILTCTNVWANV